MSHPKMSSRERRGYRRGRPSRRSQSKRKPLKSNGIRTPFLRDEGTNCRPSAREERKKSSSDIRYNHHKFSGPNPGELSSNLPINFPKGGLDGENELAALSRRVRKTFEEPKGEHCGGSIRRLWLSHCEEGSRSRTIE